MKSWNPMHLKKCGWYLDCPLKIPPTFDIALCDFVQWCKGISKAFKLIA